MARGKGVKSRPSNQKSIASFFGGGKKNASPPPDTDITSESANETQPDEEEEEEDEVAENNSSDVDMDAPSASNKKGGKSSAPDASDLPPINEIPAIFDDLVSRIPEIREVVEHVHGRKLRVATMCSGTESPLLALELIQEAIFKQHGLNFLVEHVFSCEIEPFKQAYIERNFHPPLLFRDVCELGDGEAYVS